MWHRYYIALACVYIMFVQSESEVFQVNEKRNAQRYCGKILADVLSLVCQGKYYSRYNKKSYIENDSDEDYEYEQQYLEDARFPFKPKSNAAALVPAVFRRYTRGVHDECCKKPCSPSELLSYCAAR